MKKNSLLAILTATALLLCLSSCQDGAKGPEGPTGADGTGSWLCMQFVDGRMPQAAYDGTTDNYFSVSGNTAVAYSNEGTSEELYAGYSSANITSTAAVRFDISAMPSVATVKKAYLRIYVSTAGYEDVFYLHRMTGPWSETGSSWMSRTADVLWDTAGGDYGSAACSAGVTVNASGYFYSFEMDPAVVQAWVADSGVNYGIALKTHTVVNSHRYIKFASSNEATKNIRPELTVYYTLDQGEK